MQEEELDALNRIVVMFLDYAENQARRNIPMTMTVWIEKLDAFLVFNDYKVLKNAGKISHTIAKKFAEDTYEIFRVQQDLDFNSDFDKSLKELKNKKQ